MKIKEWFKNLLAGMAIGAGSSIPGVSGGTIAVILGVYEKFVWAVSNIFKAFKKAVIYLLPMVIGMVLAIIPMVYLMDKALNYFLFGIVCLFAGFIVGSIPGITDEVKDAPIKKSYIITAVITLVIAIGLGVGSVLVKADVSSSLVNPEWWMYLVLIPVGFVASIALVVPGLSGGMLLLLLGFYKPLIETTVGTAKDCLAGDWSNFGQQLAILACFAVGVILGFFLISKLMHFLLNKYREITFYGIIGFVVGSTIALFYNYEIYAYYLKWLSNETTTPAIEIPIGIVLLVIACMGSYLLVKYKRKIDSKKEEESTAE